MIRVQHAVARALIGLVVVVLTGAGCSLVQDKGADRQGPSYDEAHRMVQALVDGTLAKVAPELAAKARGDYVNEFPECGDIGGPRTDQVVLDYTHEFQLGLDQAERVFRAVEREWRQRGYTLSASTEERDINRSTRYFDTGPYRLTVEVIRERKAASLEVAAISPCVQLPEGRAPTGG